jgi:hypothetical protein
MAKRILALVSEPVSGEALRSAVGSSADDAEVLVVAPALTSRTRFWTSDNDEAIARADEVQQESVERMDEQGVDAAGGDLNWAEDGLVEDAERLFSQPVRHLEVGAG